MRVEGLDGRCLLVRPRDKEAAERVVRDLALAEEIDVLPLDDGRRPRRGLLRAARKWNLDSWRGTPLGSTYFDEFVEAIGVARVLEHYGCEGVLCLDGHMPVLDPHIATAMLAQQRECDAEAKMMFTQAPPGLAGIILRRELTRELLEQNVPLGLLLSYRPEIPRGDPINQPVCTSVDAGISHTAARLTADTRHSRELLSAALAELGNDVDAGELCAWLRQPQRDQIGPLPLEVELELTTDDPLPETSLRPRGERVPERQLTDLDTVDRIAAELAEYDDRRIVLGGHGDPLAHPQFAGVCGRIRAAGVCALGVVTPLVDLSDENLAALLDQDVDIVQVRLDANTAETYRRLHGADHFARVVANVERIEKLRQERTSPEPLVACSLTRCAATIDELEPFYDHWIQTTGWAVIEGYNDYCGLLPEDSLLATVPPTREPCRRLNSRMLLLADGAAASCSQDYRGEQVLGRWLSEPLADIWRGEALAAVRRAHAELNVAELPICPGCREWFRT